MNTSRSSIAPASAPSAKLSAGLVSKVHASVAAVQDWVERHDYKGYDPGDGLTSFLRPLTFGNLFAERLLQQAIWKSPINIRPLVGVRPLDSTKGRGFMAWGHFLRYGVGKEPDDLQKAKRCLEWLDQVREPGHAGHCWGNHFDFSTRSGRMKAHTPTIVWSGLIGQAYLEGFEKTGDEWYLDTAESICRWVLSLPRERTATGDCLSYTGVFQNSVHNSNLLGAALLARTWKHRPKDEYLDVAHSAVEYTCSRQLPDGAWWYGEEEKYHWIDNFHTGYNLDSLKRYADGTGDRSFDGHIRKGYAYFKSVFFEETGRPRYYHNSTYPVDIQCAAQAIDTFSFFAGEDPEGLEYAMRVAAWTIDSMQASTGNFYYREYPWMKARTPYFHWGQATMFKGLNHLLMRLNSAPKINCEEVALNTSEVSNALT